MGWSPRIIPPLSPAVVENALSEMDSAVVLALIEHLNLDISEAQDNILIAKINQAKFAIWHRLDKVLYTVGNRVMLLT